MSRINFNYKIMMKEVFDKKSNVEINENHFGEYFMYYYPQYKENRYYFNRDIVTTKWENIFDVSISRIESVKGDTYNDYGTGELEKSIIYYEGKYYLVLGDVDLSIESYYTPGKYTVALFVKFPGIPDRKVIKTKLGFKRLFNQLELKPFS